MSSAPRVMGLCRTDEATEPALERARDAADAAAEAQGRRRARRPVATVRLASLLGRSGASKRGAGRGRDTVPG